MKERRRDAAAGARSINDRPQRIALVAGAALLVLAAFTVAARAETDLPSSNATWAAVTT